MENPQSEFHFMGVGVNQSENTNETIEEDESNPDDDDVYDDNDDTYPSDDQQSMEETETEYNSMIFLPVHHAEIQPLINSKTTTGERPLLYPIEWMYPPQEEYHFDSELPMLPPLPFNPVPPKNIERMVQEGFQSVTCESSKTVRGKKKERAMKSKRSTANSIAAGRIRVNL
ncbi:hypothetical protein VTN77DRAFT_6313 [Rasamsonia byssochlamydoides]|uniref:uncharacterized protein n=1 Tax=Rasamsonia byssochlamydoides TaxID=89139 RepID=UPI003744381E